MTTRDPRFGRHDGTDVQSGPLSASFRLLSSDYAANPMSDAGIKDELRRLSAIHSEAKRKDDNSRDAFRAICASASLGTARSDDDYASAREARTQSGEALKTAEAALRSALQSVPLAILARMKRDAEVSTAKAAELRAELARGPARVRKALGDLLAEVRRHYGVTGSDEAVRAHAVLWVQHLCAGGPRKFPPLGMKPKTSIVNAILADRDSAELAPIFGPHERDLPNGLPSIQEQLEQCERIAPQSVCRATADVLADRLIAEVFPHGLPIQFKAQAT